MPETRPAKAKMAASVRGANSMNRYSAREVTTLLMLGSVAWMAGMVFLKRLAAFLFLFGVWDLVYYLGLKIILDWPESLFTPDILFLIPVAWVGPVLAPVLCSLLMVLMAVLFDHYRLQHNQIRLDMAELLLVFSGAAVIFYTFTAGFGRIRNQGDFLRDCFRLAVNPEFLGILTAWQPERFDWPVFSAGMVIICAGVYRVHRRAKG